ncbi:MAG: prepilin-type N-terminal cleavage/methylation domain-containing protein [Holophagaceae bacterium]|uniref:Prepilin-type N-terminal cleavage/methylation domain-containing protein n=1 Tax=Candidatus Geothrix odensensis TaxID=2954440 RepID=A0A936K8D1_9BACT|nr:prepilin-type N-terminal cleavage/methylation domain-containing protein [Candidatus Geothrix odensensis]
MNLPRPAASRLRRWFHAPFPSASGFTLIELVVVLTLLALLATVGLAVQLERCCMAKEAPRRTCSEITTPWRAPGGSGRIPSSLGPPGSWAYLRHPLRPQVTPVQRGLADRAGNPGPGTT